MPLLLQFNATVLCAHGGKAVPVVPNPRVKLMGTPSILQSSPCTVAGCTFVPPAGVPCVTGNWVMGTVRAMSMGQPLVLQNSPTVSAPTGAPFNAIPICTRDQAT